MARVLTTRIKQLDFPTPSNAEESLQPAGEPMQPAQQGEAKDPLYPQVLFVLHP